MKTIDKIHATEKGVVAWFASNPVAANLLMIAILILGLFSAINLRVEGFPALPARFVTITVDYISGSAQQAEEGIAAKIESTLEGVPGIKEIQSVSHVAGATVIVEREEGYDLKQLTDDITTKVDSIYGWPAGAEKPVITQEIWEDHALFVNVYGDLDQDTLQQLTRALKEDLLRSEFISKIQQHGWRNPEIAIEVDESVLQAYGLTLQDIVERLAAESFTATAGELRSEGNSILLKADQQRYYLQDFNNVVIASNTDGSQLMLKDIARIDDSFENNPQVRSRFNGKPSVNLNIIVDQRSNILEVAEATKHIVTQWKAGNRLPENADIAVWWDQSVYMTDRLELLFENGVIGIVLVMAVVALFLNVRVAFWVGMGLPICFAGALWLMDASILNLSLNDLTTFGFIIVLGILVDDAVVVGESIYSTRQQEGDSLQATIQGVKKVAVPTMFGVLTTVAAFYPLSLISGEMGALFGQFAIVGVVCLLFSLLESKLILPAHLAHLNTKPTTGKTNVVARGFSWLQKLATGLLEAFSQKIYEPVLNFSLRHRYGVLACFFSLLVLVVGLIPSGQLRVVFFPDIPRDIIEVYYSAEEGAGYGVAHGQAEAIEQLADQLNQQWLASGESSSAVIRSLQSIVADDQSGHIVMELNPASERTLNTDAVAQALRERVGKSGALRDIQFVTDWGGLDDFVLKVQSDSKAEVKRAMSEITSALNAVQGVHDIKNDMNAGQLQIQLSLTAAGRALGLTTADLAQQVQHGYYGAEVQRFQRGKDEVKVMVRYPEALRTDITQLQHARIRTPTGEAVPLLSVATLAMDYVMTEINHVDGRLSATLKAGIDKQITSPANVMRQVQAQIIPPLQRDMPGLSVVIGGEAREQAETGRSMLKMFGLSLMAIYILLAIPLKSYSQPLIIMAAIPFGVVGALLGHYLMGLSVSLLSVMGILALSGVVVNDSLLLVNRFNQLRQQGMAVKAALKASAQSRLRAIVLTSLTTYVGLTSLLQESSEQAQYLIPAAASLAYGILFATGVTLLLIPVLLSAAEDVIVWMGRFSKPTPVLEKEDPIAEVA